MDIWMKVTPDEYEFPLQIADTQKELAMTCGIQRHTISSAMYKAKKKGHKCCYVRVEIEDDE